MSMEKDKAEHRPHREPFDAFCSEVDALHHEWVVWDYLFAGSDVRKQRPEVTADRVWPFFRVVWLLVPRFAVLRLCKLTDPMEDKQGRKSLTAEAVFEETFGGTTDDRLEQWKPAVQEARDWAEKKAKVLRPHRHKTLAHKDLDVATLEKQPTSINLNDLGMGIRGLVTFKHRLKKCRAGEPLTPQTTPEEAGSLDPPSSVENQWRAEVDSLVEVLSAGLKALEAT